MKADPATDLYGNRELRKEAFDLELELLKWCAKKIEHRCRPVAVQHALSKVAKIMKTPHRYSFETPVVSTLGEMPSQ